MRAIISLDMDEELGLIFNEFSPESYKFKGAEFSAVKCNKMWKKQEKEERKAARAKIKLFLRDNFRGNPKFDGSVSFEDGWVTFEIEI